MLGANGAEHALSDPELRRNSGSAVFERGAAYARSGAVVLDAAETTMLRASAAVHGSTVYTTSLEWAGHRLVADCTCPAGGFCKHLVALAMVWRAHREGAPVPGGDRGAGKSASAEKRAATQRAKQSALEAFLQSQPADALIDRLLAIADELPQVSRSLHAWQALARIGREGSDPRKDIRDLLTPGGRFVDRRSIGAFMRRAMEVVPYLAAHRRADPRSALDLATLALKRTWALIGRIDDSGGEITLLAAQIGEEWLLALEAVGEPPPTFADVWFKLWRQEGHEWTDAERVEACMGKACLLRYRKLVADAWHDAVEAAKAHRASVNARQSSRSGKAGADAPDSLPWELRWATMKAQREHLRLLQRAGDVEAMLDVLRADPDEPSNAVACIVLLDRLGRTRSAISEAESAIRRFPGDEPIEDALLTILERDGWTEEALRLRAVQIERKLGAERYIALLKAGRDAKVDIDSLRAAVMARVTAQEDAAMATPQPWNGPGPAIRDITLRAVLLGAEERWSEVNALVESPGTGCSAHLLKQLALRLPPPEWPLACRLLMRVLGASIRQAQSPYREALSVVHEIATRLPDDERRQWLDALRREHRAKRRFIAGLPG